MVISVCLAPAYRAGDSVLQRKLTGALIEKRVCGKPKLEGTGPTG